MSAWPCVSVMKQKRIVLLVEDDEDLRRMFRTALVLEGFYVYEAANGYDALSVLEQDATDLVVLDLRLPRIDGLSVLEEIQATTRNLPVVIVTGSDLDLSRFDVDCILRKPISPDILVKTVHECLKKHGH